MRKDLLNKHHVIAGLCAFICFVNVFLSYGETYDIPEKIRVGLRFGNSGVVSAQMESEKGFQMGYMDSQEQFVELWDLANAKKIFIRKDSYYIYLGNYYYEYDFNSPLDDNNNDIAGPIHIQAGGDFATKTEASAYAETLKALGIDAYIALEGTWKVWIGTYRTYGLAERDFDEIKSLLGQVEMRVISYDSSRIQVLDDQGHIILIYNPGYGDYCFQAKEEGLITMDNKIFRGAFVFKNASNGNISVINYLDLEHYLYGVLPKEMSYTYPMEALKAQAVVARSYVVENANSHEADGFDICISTHCQVYGGYSDEKPATSQSVDQTKDQILLYQGKPVTAFYHSNSGGHTENTENIWVSMIPYLRGVKDIFSPDYLWEVSYTPSELETLLKEKGYNQGSINNVYVAEVSDYMSVQKLVISGTQGDIILEKEAIRSVFGYGVVKSLKFNVIRGTELYVENNILKNGIDLGSTYVMNGQGHIVKIDNNSIIYTTNGQIVETYQNQSGSVYKFKGRGYGHGIGMSQAGAKGMAQLGYEYKEILHHYYTDVVVAN